MQLYMSIHHARSSIVIACIVTGLLPLFGSFLPYLTTAITCIVACRLLPVLSCPVIGPVIVLYFQHFNSSTLVQLHSAGLGAK
jgi:hypothetical protein